MIKKSSKAFFLSLLLLSISACASNDITAYPPNSDSSDSNPFSYDGNYENPELVLDGIKDEEEWLSEYASETITLSYVNTPAEDENTYECNVTFYRGESQLYVFFDVEDCNILSVENDNGDNVALSDSIEIYLDTLNDGGERPQRDDYQINLGVHSKTRILIGTGSGWSTWTGLVSYETVINGTLNDETDVDIGWTLEAAIPYKQIGITRDQVLGLSLGLVNKYSAKTTYSKQWYGLRKDGHYGSVQVPDSYFVYGKNTITPPMAPDYDITQDTHEYNKLGTISGGAQDSNAVADIDVEVSRSESDVLALRFSIDESGWNSYFPIWMFFDAGAKTKTTRDRESWSMRISPTTGIITNFFYLDGTNDAISTSQVTSRKSSTHLYISYCLSSLDEDFTDRDIGLAFCTAYNNVVYHTMAYKNAVPDLRDPSTFVWFTKDNAVFVPNYDPLDDQTVYLSGKWNVAAASIGTEVIPQMEIAAARHGNQITFRFSHTTASWSDKVGLWGYFDSGDKNKIGRDENSFSIRIVPTTGAVTDFFYISPNHGIDKSIVTVLVNDNFVYCTFDITQLGIDIATDFGLAFSTADLATKRVLTKATFEGDVNIDITNPSSFVWINQDNEIVSGAEQIDYLADDIGIIARKTVNETTYGQITPQVSRSRAGYISFKFTSEANWASDEYIVIYLDKGDGTDLVRTENTWALRFNPSTLTVKDHFYITTSQAISKTGIELTGTATQVEISIPLNSVSAATSTVGFTLASARTTSCTIVSFLSLNNSEINGSNPSRFIRINSDNTLESRVYE